MENMVEGRKRNDTILNRILNKYKECKDITFIKLAIYQLEVLIKYMNLMKVKGAAAFPNRLEYQKFGVAKLFMDKINLLEFSVDPSLKGFLEHKDGTLPPIDAFHMTPNVKEDRKIKFLRNLKRGDVLHLKVVEECNINKEYKLLVINKYNEKERVADYFIYAYVLKSSPCLANLPQPVRINDFVRAAVFSKQKIEGNVLKKLIVTLNPDRASDEYKNLVKSPCRISGHRSLRLGIILKSEIPFYPEDVSNYNSLLNYIEANKKPEVDKDLIKSISSVGIDPYKIYSYHESADGKKLGVPKEHSSTVELKKMEQSMNLLKETEKQIVGGKDPESILPMLERALEIYPKNDAAYAFRGQVYKALFINKRNVVYLKKALRDFEEALKFNGYNFIATREYLILLVLSADLFQLEGNKAKADEITKIVDQCKDVCDMSEYLVRNVEEGEL